MEGGMQLAGSVGSGEVIPQRRRVRRGSICPPIREALTARSISLESLAVPSASLTAPARPQLVELVGTKGVPTIRPRLRRVEQRAGCSGRRWIRGSLGGRPRPGGDISTLGAG